MLHARSFYELYFPVTSSMLLADVLTYFFPFFAAALIIAAFVLQNSQNLCDLHSADDATPQKLTNWEYFSGAYQQRRVAKIIKSAFTDGRKFPICPGL